MRLLRSLILFGFCFAVTGCALNYKAPLVAPRGFFFSSVTAPLTTNFDKTVVATKKGTASTHYVHDILLTGMNFAWDDALLKKAAEDGGITNVTYADYTVFTVLGVVASFTVNAYGN